MKRRAFLKSAAATAFAAGFFPQAASSETPGPDVAKAEALAESPYSGPGLYYKPKGGRVGDVIPFYDQGEFRIFHLYQADHEKGITTWHQVTTKDFIHFSELGTMLPRGTRQDQDLSVATGSVIKDKSGRYHAFYTGYNTVNMANKPQQGVMHADSEDLVHWEKRYEDTFYAPTAIYERNDWRDPFVFWNEEAGEYWMLVAARLNTGPSRRRGCTALCTSKDLTHWEAGKPFWAPGLYYTHECPDLFKIGEWWYLVFSEFSESNQTRYRMSRNITGPWIAPEDDVFDCRALYAAKTTSNGKERFLFGWNPLKTGSTDDGKWEWGGTLVMHQLLQRPNGELYVDLPASIGKAFKRSMPINVRSAFGKCDVAADRVTIDTPQSLGIATVAPLPTQCKIVTNIGAIGNCRSFGLMLKLLDDLDTCYFVRFEPARNRMVLDLWRRPGDVPFITGFERPLKLTPGEPIELQVILDGTIAEIYVAGKIAMSARLYKPNAGQLGVFSDEGTVTFSKLGIFSMENHEIPG